jgi:hypothetical protein
MGRPIISARYINSRFFIRRLSEVFYHSKKTTLITNIKAPALRRERGKNEIIRRDVKMLLYIILPLWRIWN